MENTAQIYKDVETQQTYVLLGKNSHSNPICGLRSTKDGEIRFVTDSELNDPKKFEKIK